MAIPKVGEENAPFCVFWTNTLGRNACYVLLFSFCQVINSREAGGLMAVGIDVYHDKGSARSCAAIVCSINTEVTKFYSEVVFQENRQEIISKLKMAFLNAIKKYHSVRCITFQFHIY